MAVSIVLFFGAFIPMLGILVAPFSPLPLTILTMKYGPRHGAAVAMVTVGCLSLLFTAIVGLAFVPFVFVGLVLGTLAQRGARGTVIMVIGTLATAALLMGLFYGYEAIALRDPSIMTADETLSRFFDDTRELGRRMLKAGSGALVDFEDGVTQLQKLTRVILYFPLVLMTLVGGMGFAMTYFVGHRLLAELGLPIPGLPPFRTWRGPWWLTWGMIGSFVVGTAATSHGWGEGQVYAYNVFFVFLLFYMLMGLAILEHFLVRIGVDPVLRVVVHLLAVKLAFMPVPVVTIAGLLDPWLDLRRLGAAPADGDDDGGPPLIDDDGFLEKGDDD